MLAGWRFFTKIRALSEKTPSKSHKFGHYSWCGVQFISNACNYYREICDFVNNFVRNSCDEVYAFLFQVDLPTKLFLAHGVVCGMDYLHSIDPHPVIHGELNLQNVRVGDGLVAKVCVIFPSCQCF